MFNCVSNATSNSQEREEARQELATAKAALALAQDKVRVVSMFLFSAFFFCSSSMFLRVHHHFPANMSFPSQHLVSQPTSRLLLCRMPAFAASESLLGTGYDAQPMQVRKDERIFNVIRGSIKWAAEPRPTTPRASGAAARQAAHPATTCQPSTKQSIVFPVRDALTSPSAAALS